MDKYITIEDLYDNGYFNGNQDPGSAFFILKQDPDDEFRTTMRFNPKHRDDYVDMLGEFLKTFLNKAYIDTHKTHQSHVSKHFSHTDIIDIVDCFIWARYIYNKSNITSRFIYNIIFTSDIGLCSGYTIVEENGSIICLQQDGRDITPEGYINLLKNMTVMVDKEKYGTETENCYIWQEYH